MQFGVQFFVTVDMITSLVMFSDSTPRRVNTRQHDPLTQRYLLLTRKIPPFERIVKQNAWLHLFRTKQYSNVNIA